MNITRRYQLFSLFAATCVATMGCPTTTAPDDDDDDSTPFIDEGVWEDLSLGLNVSLNGVWGQAPGVVWIAGSNGRLFTYNGGSFQAATFPDVIDDFNGIWGSQAGDLVVAVGENGLVYRNTSLSPDGWAPWDFPFNFTLNGVWGFSSSDVYVCGFGGIAHWDGTTWSAEDLPINATLRSIWGSSPDDLWAVGDAGVILHRTAEGWQDLSTGVTADNLNDVWGAGGMTFVVGDRGALSYSVGGGPMVEATIEEDLENTLWSAWAASPSDLYTGGMNGHIYHWDGPGGAVGLEEIPTSELVVTIVYDIWGFTPNDVWAVGNRGTVLHYSGPSQPAGGADE